VVMPARQWSFAVLQRRTTKQKPNQHCFLAKGMLYVCMSLYTGTSVAKHVIVVIVYEAEA